MKRLRLAGCVLLGATLLALGWIVYPMSEPGIVNADETAIFVHRADHPLTVFRFAQDKKILVLDFADLADQAQMLNRVAALTEKAGCPRNRVLDNTALQDAIRKAGETPETFYLGHDYSAAELRLFFTLVDIDRVALTAWEQQLRRLLTAQGWLEPDAVGAVISIPSIHGSIDAGMRRAILHHELSHGAYFTLPAYTAAINRFWQNDLTDTDRAAFRHMLASEGYDPTNEDLMINETQAYLGFTADPRFFDPASLHLPPGRVERLRSALIADLPAAWPRP